jgi:pimeloyl-ACP methyl ester carboxylesterase
MHGDADPVVPVEHAHAYAACIPGARLTVVPGYGHVLPATARDALAAAVSDVVAEAV